MGLFRGLLGALGCFWGFMQSSPELWEAAHEARRKGCPRSSYLSKLTFQTSAAPNSLSTKAQFFHYPASLNNPNPGFLQKFRTKNFFSPPRSIVKIFTITIFYQKQEKTGVFKGLRVFLGAIQLSEAKRGGQNAECGRRNAECGTKRALSTVILHKIRCADLYKRQISG